MMNGKIVMNIDVDNQLQNTFSKYGLSNFTVEALPDNPSSTYNDNICSLSPANDKTTICLNYLSGISGSHPRCFQQQNPTDPFPFSANSLENLPLGSFNGKGFSSIPFLATRPLQAFPTALSGSVFSNGLTPSSTSSACALHSLPSSLFMQPPPGSLPFSFQAQTIPNNLSSSSPENAFNVFQRPLLSNDLIFPQNDVNFPSSVRTGDKRGRARSHSNNAKPDPPLQATDHDSISKKKYDSRKKNISNSSSISSRPFPSSLGLVCSSSSSCPSAPFFLPCSISASGPNNFVPAQRMGFRSTISNDANIRSGISNATSGNVPHTFSSQSSHPLFSNALYLDFLLSQMISNSPSFPSGPPSFPSSNCPRPQTPNDPNSALSIPLDPFRPLPLGARVDSSSLSFPASRPFFFSSSPSSLVPPPPLASPSPPLLLPFSSPSPPPPASTPSPSMTSITTTAPTLTITPASARNPDRVKQMERQLREKLERLRALESENAALKFRHSFLEQLVGIRSYQIDVKTDGDADRPLPALTHFKRNVNLTIPRGPKLVPDSVPGSVPKAPQGLDIRIHEASDNLIPLSPEEREKFKVMTCQAFISQWRVFLTEASICLQALESNPDDVEAAKRLEILVIHSAYETRNTFLLAPRTFLRVMCVQMETAEGKKEEEKGNKEKEEEEKKEGIASPEFWKAVARKIGFTPDQEARLLCLYGLYDKAMKKLLDERRQLQRDLEQGMQIALDGNKRLQQRELHPECTTLRRLSKNLQRELDLHEMMRGYLYGRMLTLLQYSKVAVYSYPYFPDATALVCALADLKKEQQGERGWKEWGRRREGEEGEGEKK